LCGSKNPLERDSVYRYTIATQTAAHLRSALLQFGTRIRVHLRRAPSQRWSAANNCWPPRQFCALFKRSHCAVLPTAQARFGQNPSHFVTARPSVDREKACSRKVSRDKPSSFAPRIDFHEMRTKCQNDLCDPPARRDQAIILQPPAAPAAIFAAIFGVFRAFVDFVVPSRPTRPRRVH